MTMTPNYNRMPGPGDFWYQYEDEEEEYRDDEYDDWYDPEDWYDDDPRDDYIN